MPWGAPVAYARGMLTLQSPKPHFTRGLGLPWAARSLACVAACLPLVLTGCNQAEQESKIAEIQQKADERVAKAEREGRERILALERQIETIKTEAAAASAKAKVEADDAISKAQASAEEAAKATEDATKAAEKAVKNAREAYKGEGRTRLAELNKELVELVARAAKTPAKERVGYDEAMKEVTSHQKEIAKDVAAFDQATVETFRTAKAKLTKDLALMKAALKTARGKLPKAEAPAAIGGAPMPKSAAPAPATNGSPAPIKTGTAGSKP